MASLREPGAVAIHVLTHIGPILEPDEKMRALLSAFSGLAKKRGPKPAGELRVEPARAK